MVVADQGPDDDPVSISCVMTVTRTSARNAAANKGHSPETDPSHASARRGCTVFDVALYVIVISEDYDDQ